MIFMWKNLNSEDVTMVQVQNITSEDDLLSGGMFVWNMVKQLTNSLWISIKFYFYCHFFIQNSHEQHFFETFEEFVLKLKYLDSWFSKSFQQMIKWGHHLHVLTTHSECYFSHLWSYKYDITEALDHQPWCFVCKQPWFHNKYAVLSFLHNNLTMPHISYLTELYIATKTFLRILQMNKRTGRVLR